jgi:hypothetical protein
MILAPVGTKQEYFSRRFWRKGIRNDFSGLDHDDFEWNHPKS